MSIVVITGSGPEHRFVANRIVAAHGAKAIFVCDPAPRRSWRVVLRRSPVRFADKALRRLYLRAIGDAAAREATLRRILGRDSDAFARPDLVLPVGRPKDGLLARTIAGLRPRIVAVYGTGVVPDDVLALADQVALNMHTGLSPWYRGTPARSGRSSRAISSGSGRRCTSARRSSTAAGYSSASGRRSTGATISTRSSRVPSGPARTAMSTSSPGRWTARSPERPRTSASAGNTGETHWA